jgi:uncharacterized membrane protein
MNQRIIGIVLIVVALVIAGLTFYARMQAENAINAVANETGSCYVNGTCLHSQSTNFALVAWGFSGVLVLIGLYLIIFNRSQQKIFEHTEKLQKAVEEVKSKHEKDEFEVFLAAFDDKEKLLLKAIKEQDGILQSTLRYRVGMSKAALSQKLTEFEKKGLISRKVEGKTNKVFLRKRF